MTGRAVMVAWLVLLVILVARWWQQRDGQLRRPGGGGGSPRPGQVARPRGDVRSAVLVTTPTCGACPEVRAALAEVAASTDGFTWEEVDAADDLDFVRAHAVVRAPTVLFRDAAGTVVARAAGAISRDQVAAAVAPGGLAAVG